MRHTLAFFLLFQRRILFLSFSSTEFLWSADGAIRSSWSQYSYWLAMSEIDVSHVCGCDRVAFSALSALSLSSQSIVVNDSMRFFYFVCVALAFRHVRTRLALRKQQYFASRIYCSTLLYQQNTILYSSFHFCAYLYRQPTELMFIENQYDIDVCLQFYCLHSETCSATEDAIVFSGTTLCSYRNCNLRTVKRTHTFHSRP